MDFDKNTMSNTESTSSIFIKFNELKISIDFF